VAVAAPERRSLAALTDEEAGNLVTAYAKAVVAGDVVAGELVRKACQRHLDDLETGEARGLRFDAAEAGFRIRFFPAMFRHYKGEWGPLPGIRREGLPIELEPWEAFIVGSVFGWLRENPNPDSPRRWIRRFRRLYLEVAKKNGKTLLAAGLAVIFGFFDEEPGAEVYTAATKKDQARLLLNDELTLVEKSPALSRRIRRSVKALFDPETMSKSTALSSEEGGEDGINPHAGFVDELHRHRNRDMVDLISNSFGSREQPFLAEITTAGIVGESIWGEEHDYAEKVVTGVVEDDSLLALIYTVDKGDDPLTDESCWPKANPNLGVSVKVDDLRALVLEAREKPGKQPAVLRLRFNVRTQAATRAIDIDAWDRNAAKPEASRGSAAWLGLDLGWTRDLCCAALWIPTGDGYFDLLLRTWCPEVSARLAVDRDRMPYDRWRAEGWMTFTEGNVRDDDRILEDLIALRDDDGWDIREVRYDRAMASNLVRRLEEAGFVVEPQSQYISQLSGPFKELERFYLAGKIRTGGNPVLRWMASNVETKEDDNGNARPVKPNGNSPLKIDGISATLDAIAAWLAADKEDPFVSVYERRGIEAFGREAVFR
jgi:phage terminase large subunit-like protein